MEFQDPPKGRIYTLLGGQDSRGMTYFFEQVIYNSFEDMQKRVALQNAAPELLEALGRARAGLEWYIDMCPEYADDSDAETLEQIDAAIKKATESPYNEFKVDGVGQGSLRGH